MNRFLSPAIVAALAIGSAAYAQPVSLNLDRDITPEGQTTTESFPVSVAPGQAALYYKYEVTLPSGRLTLRLLDPAGTVVDQQSAAEALTMQGKATTGQPGTYSLEVVTEGAVGHWKVIIQPVLAPSAFRPNLISGPAMLLVAVGSVLWWRWRSHAAWRWFWVGAGVWTVGVALKFAVALPLNGPVLRGLEDVLPRFWYLVIGGVYIGLLTGVFEIGVTLVAGLIWRRFALDSARAIAVGVGAGAFEAALLGLLSLIGMAVAVSGLLPDEAVAAVSAVMLVTPLGWLAPPVERAIAILCHTSSRALTFLTVATRRSTYFWGGFLIMTAIDSVAGAYLISGALTSLSAWWIELAIAPAALISLPVLRWCIRHWPVVPPPAVLPVETAPAVGPSSAANAD
ncbi:MAG TPA: YhfC family glutamic-type intramembrane protease [Phycisphaerae bacterium]|nr:YhfC family glutamic-type intramembrane protease [Phycisphaerae bacterium]HNU44129.1 YhfC family glutamic-type intramembrane protease [Phycisphaerae bacterium]